MPKTPYNHNQQTLFSINDVARRWSISRGSIYTLLNSQSLRSVTINSRRLIMLAEIERFERELGESR